MREINKKLIISDFDGTLTTSEHTLSKRTRSAINEYVSSGGVFAVCTGRMVRAILPHVRELGLKGLVAAYQGGVIVDIESGKVLRNNTLTVEEGIEICRFVEKFNYTCNTYANEILYTSIPVGDKRVMVYESVTGVKAENVNMPMSEFLQKKKLACNKVTFLVYPEDREELYGLLKTRFAGKFDVTCSSASLVEVSSLNDTKGAALKFIAEYFGIDMSSTVAIGDNLNDLSMINAAALGVAVGNATDEVKRQADYVCASNDEDGVAEIIEKFGYK